MKELVCDRFFYVMVLIILLVSLLFIPHPSSALRPLDKGVSQNPSSLVNKKIDEKSETHLRPISEKLLDDLSPSLVAPPKVKISSQEYNYANRLKFESSVCFKRCHNKNDFYPSDHTAKQWRLLIGQEGHTIFSEIPWESPQQKKEVLDYLLNNARKSRPDSAGIGVW